MFGHGFTGHYQVNLSEMNDSTLLQTYLREKSQAAFAELVRRHFPLVYRAALRRTGGNAALAEEIAQSVFTLLARKAPLLANHPTLAGWLHTTTYRSASGAQRAEHRRLRRELEAYRMSEPCRGNSHPPDWSRVQPVVDEALQRLESRDREAILLRFFEDRPFAEIAARLNVTEDAARMRVNRALARLHGILSSIGIPSTEAALAVLLESEAAASNAVPAVLAAGISQSAFAAGQSAGTVADLLCLMSTKKTILATAVVAAVLGGLGADLSLHRRLSVATAKIYSLQLENDRLRERITAAMLANPPRASWFASSTSAAPQGKDGRMSAVISQIELREASRDALPTSVAHPLKFRGYDTPIHAVESFAWANYRSDVEMLARSLYLNDAARAATERIRTSLSAAMQAQYPTAESLIAMCIAYDAIRFPGPNSEDYLIDAPEPNYIDPDDFKTPNGQQYHLTSDGWKYNFPAPAVMGFVTNVLNPKQK